MGYKMNVSGKNVALELLNKKERINKAYLYNDFSDQNILKELQKQKISIIYKSKDELSRIDKGNHQGIILDIPDFEYTHFEDLINTTNGFIVILDHLEDPHNLGAIIRTCEAANVDGIIIPKDRSVEINSTVMKTSSGALSNMKISMVTNLSNTIKKLQSDGYWIIGTAMETQEDYSSFKYSFPIALVIGNEGNGISRLVKESCDALVNIPMKGKVNSLNASVATGIVVYEIIKNRK